MKTTPSRDFASQLGYVVRAVLEYSLYGVLFTCLVLYWIVT